MPLKIYDTGKGLTPQTDYFGKTKIREPKKTSSNPVKQEPSGMPKNRGYRAEILAFTIGSGLLLIAFLFPPVKHEGHGSQQIAVQVGFLMWFGMTFVMAEIIRRVCLFSEEIFHLRTRYDGSISRVVLHVFNSRNSANFFTVIILLSLLFISSSDPMVMTEISSHWPTSFGLCGLYIIFISVVKLTENLVDCEVLLDDRVMAIGHGLAYSYYYGFLKIILPASENSQSLRDRASHFEFEEKIQLASKKMLILIPDTCFCTPSFQDMAPCGQIERVKTLEDVIICRAGMRGRPYSATVYLIQPEGSKAPVYVMMEMPSILFVLYEMNTIGHTNSKLTAFERTQQAQAFCRVLGRLLEDDPSCKDMYDIIYFKDQNANLAQMIYDHVQNTKQ
ncbi:stimulator of interferon genes protein-like isoform X1 [Daphnia magna]|uniref:stimulator of interferon genes protein isoform X1 n=1 Tax=Daphnia magna TaxID=35525 RepID=UPI0006DF2D9F|nr:stimulator of interferon genes protein isoform X1 [Daphnia magna]XP_045025506.1 stimulator of interferon genes protein-like isoform X1 [Daphnia magna]